MDFKMLAQVAGLVALLGGAASGGVTYYMNNEYVATEVFETEDAKDEEVLGVHLDEFEGVKGAQEQIAENQKRLIDKFDCAQLENQCIRNCAANGILREVCACVLPSSCDEIRRTRKPGD